MCGYEPQLYRIMAKMFGNFGSHLYRAMCRMSMSLHWATRSTYRVVCLLLAEHEAELGCLGVRIRLGPKNDHYTVL